jgi:hypothetical protein
MWAEKGLHWLKYGPALMRTLSGRIDMLFFGHGHRHLDFSKTNLSKRNKIPFIFSGGKSTEECTEYKLNKAGKPVGKALRKGLLGRFVEIDAAGKVLNKTINF